MTRKSSEPACRVCGCAEFNACEEGCSWVTTERGSSPLCSACSGMPSDVVEVCRRIRSTFRKFGLCTDTARQANAIIGALSARVDARCKAEFHNPDPAWGNR